MAQPKKKNWPIVANAPHVCGPPEVQPAPGSKLQRQGVDGPIEEPVAMSQHKKGSKRNWILTGGVVDRAEPVSRARKSISSDRLQNQFAETH
ncbi:oxidoreductase domain-containing protein [Anopheles sinensis]|uniref:Oxidoreductase domain-containing protein n=1 Tax=Anopheles sinensis TaxID=74873 RepID=A0A084WIM4_ANOSI|nr:oxidoreductase domain-containing protein [Anopheles sinensis]